MSDNDRTHLLFSIEARIELERLLTRERRRAQGHCERVVASLRDETRELMAEEKLIAAEDAAAMPGRRYGSAAPRVSVLRQIAVGLGLVRPATTGPREESGATAGQRCVEVAREQLTRLRREDGPILLTRAEEAARIIAGGDGDDHRPSDPAPRPSNGAGTHLPSRSGRVVDIG